MKGGRLLDWEVLSLMACGAAGILLGVHSLRAYLATLVWNVSRDATSAEQVGLISLMVFAVGLLAWVPTRVVGGALPALRFGILLAALVIGRHALPPNIAMPILPIAAWIVWLWWFPSFLLWLSRRGALIVVAPAVLLGLTVQVAGQMTLHGLDLHLLPGIEGLVAISIIAGIFIVALVLGVVTGRPKESVPIRIGSGIWAGFSVAPYLFLQLTLLANLGRLQVISGWALLPVALVTGVALTAGLAALAWAPSRRVRIVLGVAVLALLAPGEWMTGWAILALIPVQAALAVLLGATTTPVPGTGRGQLFAATAAGWLLACALFFVFYARETAPVTWLLAALVVVVPSVLVGPPPPFRDLRPALAGGLAVLVGAALSVAPTASANRTPAMSVAPAELRILTYNMHQGFDAWGVPSAPALADVIEAADADLVALQEVHRGTNIAGGADLVAYLRWRFPEYRIVFGPTYTSVMGNAIMSRYPIGEWGWAYYPQGRSFLTRGYVWTLISGASGDLAFLSTHLSASDGSDEERAAQAATLVEHWHGRPRLILAGDFNAVPGEAAIERLLAAGLKDLIGELEPSRLVVHDPAWLDTRIDYIFTSADIDAVSAHVQFSPASDHPPVAGTFRIGEGVR